MSDLPGWEHLSEPSQSTNASEDEVDLRDQDQIGSSSPSSSIKTKPGREKKKERATNLGGQSRSNPSNTQPQRQSQANPKANLDLRLLNLNKKRALPPGLPTGSETASSGRIPTKKPRLDSFQSLLQTTQANGQGQRKTQSSASSSSSTLNRASTSASTLYGPPSAIRMSPPVSRIKQITPRSPLSSNAARKTTGTRRPKAIPEPSQPEVRRETARKTTQPSRKRYPALAPRFSNTDDDGDDDSDGIEYTGASDLASVLNKVNRDDASESARSAGASSTSAATRRIRRSKKDRRKGRDRSKSTSRSRSRSRSQSQSRNQGNPRPANQGQETQRKGKEKEKAVPLGGNDKGTAILIDSDNDNDEVQPFAGKIPGPGPPTQSRVHRHSYPFTSSAPAPRTNAKAKEKQKVNPRRETANPDVIILSDDSDEVVSMPPPRSRPLPRPSSRSVSNIHSGLVADDDDASEREKDGCDVDMELDTVQNMIVPDKNIDKEDQRTDGDQDSPSSPIPISAPSLSRSRASLPKSIMTKSPNGPKVSNVSAATGPTSPQRTQSQSQSVPTSSSNRPSMRNRTSGVRPFTSTAQPTIISSDEEMVDSPPPSAKSVTSSSMQAEAKTVTKGAGIGMENNTMATEIDMGSGMETEREIKPKAETNNAKAKRLTKRRERGGEDSDSDSASDSTSASNPRRLESTKSKPAPQKRTKPASQQSSAPHSKSENQNEWLQSFTAAFNMSGKANYSDSSDNPKPGARVGSGLKPLSKPPSKGSSSTAPPALPGPSRPRPRPRAHLSDLKSLLSQPLKDAKGSSVKRKSMPLGGNKPLTKKPDPKSGTSTVGDSTGPAVHRDSISSLATLLSSLGNQPRKSRAERDKEKNGEKDKDGSRVGLVQPADSAEENDHDVMHGPVVDHSVKDVRAKAHTPVKSCGVAEEEEGRDAGRDGENRNQTGGGGEVGNALTQPHRDINSDPEPPLQAQVHLQPVEELPDLDYVDEDVSMDSDEEDDNGDNGRDEDIVEGKRRAQDDMQVDVDDMTKSKSGIAAPTGATVEDNVDVGVPSASTSKPSGPGDEDEDSGFDSEMHVQNMVDIGDDSNSPLSPFPRSRYPPSSASIPHSPSSESYTGHDDVPTPYGEATATTHSDPSYDDIPSSSSRRPSQIRRSSRRHRSSAYTSDSASASEHYQELPLIHNTSSSGSSLPNETPPRSTTPEDILGLGGKLTSHSPNGTSTTPTTDIIPVPQMLGGRYVITWELIRAQLRLSPPPHRFSRDLHLSHRMHDYINSYDASMRSYPKMRLVYESMIQENTSHDEPLAPPILIHNETETRDTDPTPPWEFVYSNEMWLGRDVEPPSRKGLEGCDCEGKCSKKTCKCWKKQVEYTGSYYPDGFMYDARGLLKAPGLPVFECNSLCNCGEECRNRVVAQGRKCKVMIKKTTKKGWGVFACERIRAGTFIGIYSGELLGHAESEERAVKYDAFGRTYLFDIDWWYIDNAMEKKEKEVAKAAADAEIGRAQPQGEGQTVSTATMATVDRVSKNMNSNPVEAHPDMSNADRKVEKKQRKEKKDERINRKDDTESDSDSDSDGERRKPSKYTIDAYHAGNFTRFLNHSCDPNAALTPVYIDVDDIERPLLTIFSKREISYGEEITFSYSGDLDADPEEEQQHIRPQPATPNSSKRGPKSKKNVKSKHQSVDSPKRDKKNKALVHVACQCGSAKCKGTIWRE